LPPVAADRVLAAGQDVAAVEAHLPGQRGGRRQQAHQRQDGGGLTGPGLTDQAEPLALAELEAHPLHRVHLRPGRQVEPDMEVAYLQQAHSASGPRPASVRGRHRRRDRWATFSRGFSASSTAWPNRKQPTMTAAMTNPSGTIAHQAPELIAVRWKACSRMVPHVVTVGSSSPRKASAVSR